MRIDIVLVVAALGAQPGPVGAQDTGAAAACAVIVSDGERLACYDRALRAAPPAAVPAAAAAAVTRPAGESARAAEPVVSSAEPVASSAAPTTAAAVAPAATATAVATSTPSVALNAPAASGTTTPSTLSATAPPPAHAVAPAEAPRPIVPIVVLRTRAIPGRGVEFTTDAGDVWLTDSQPLNLPATPFNAQIKPGTFGSLFLVPENRIGIRVRHRD